jgi:hypothetical protein
MTGESLAACKDTQKYQMSVEKEVKLVVPKSLIAVLWLIAGGLLLNGLYFLAPDPFNAQSYPTRVTICNANGGGCTDLVKDEAGYLALLAVQVLGIETCSPLVKLVGMG